MPGYAPAVVVALRQCEMSSQTTWKPNDPGGVPCGTVTSKYHQPSWLVPADGSDAVYTPRLPAEPPIA